MRDSAATIFMCNRLFFLLLPLILSIGACFMWPSLSIQTSFDEFVPQGHPFTVTHKYIEKILGGLNQVSILIKTTRGPIFSSEVLNKIYRLTEQLYLLEGVNISRIEGIAARKTRRVEPGPNGFKIRRLIPHESLSERELQDIQTYVKGNPMLEGIVVSPDMTATLIQADFFPETSSRSIFNNIRSLTEQIADPTLEIYYAGRPILEGWLDWYLPRMRWLFGLCAVVLGSLLYAVFGSVRAVAICFCAALMPALWGLAAVPLLRYHLTPATVLVPFFVFSLGICHSVQFMKRYFHESQHAVSRSDAARNVFRALLVPASASLITDSIGFFSLLLIPLDLIKGLALTAGIGILSLFVSVILFLPAVLSYVPVPCDRWRGAVNRRTLFDRLLPWLAGHIQTHRRAIIALFVLLGICSMGCMSYLSVGDNQPGSSTLYPDSHYNRSARLITELFSSADPLYILVRGTVNEALVSSEVLHEMESLQKHILEHVPGAVRARSLVEHIKAFNMIFNGFDPAFFRIPQLDATIGEYLFLYSIAGYPGDFDFLCDRDFTHANIRIDMGNRTTATVNTIIHETAAWIAASHRSARITFAFPGGLAGIQAAIHDTIRSTIPLSVLCTALALFVCASLFLQSMRIGFILLMPLLLSLVLTLGIMGLLSIPLTIETLPLASLGMGIGIDYGIYMVAAIPRASITGAAILQTLATSGKAVFFSAVSMALSSLLLIFSPVRMDATLGTCLSLLLFINMLSALIFLPALLARNHAKKLFVPVAAQSKTRCL